MVNNSRNFVCFHTSYAEQKHFHNKFPELWYSVRQKLSVLLPPPRSQLARGNFDVTVAVSNYEVDKSQGSGKPTLKLVVHNKRLSGYENQ